jgi:hypothetical protein
VLGCRERTQQKQVSDRECRLVHKRLQRREVVVESPQQKPVKVLIPRRTFAKDWKLCHAKNNFCLFGIHRTRALTSA